MQKARLKNQGTLLTLSGVRKAVALTTWTSGNRHLILLSCPRLYYSVSGIVLIRSWPKEIFKLHGWTRTYEKIISLLFQVIWEIPEELRMELSRLGSNQRYAD